MWDSRMPEEQKEEHDARQAGVDDSGGWFPTWAFGVVPLVVAGLMLFFAMHV